MNTAELTSRVVLTGVTVMGLRAGPRSTGEAASAAAAMARSAHDARELWMDLAATGAFYPAAHARAKSIRRVNPGCVYRHPSYTLLTRRGGVW
jgi:hypothetical protein